VKGQTHVPHTSSPPPQVQIKLSGSIISSTRIQWRAGLDVLRLAAWASGSVYWPISVGHLWRIFN